MESQIVFGEATILLSGIAFALANKRWEEDQKKWVLPGVVILIGIALTAAATWGMYQFLLFKSEHAGYSAWGAVLGNLTWTMISIKFGYWLADGPKWPE